MTEYCFKMLIFKVACLILSLERTSWLWWNLTSQWVPLAVCETCSLLQPSWSYLAACALSLLIFSEWSTSTSHLELLASDPHLFVCLSICFCILVSPCVLLSLILSPCFIFEVLLEHCPFQLHWYIIMRLYSDLYPKIFQGNNASWELTNHFEPNANEPKFIDLVRI